MKLIYKSLGGVALSVGLYFLISKSPFSGIVPLLHIGIARQFSEQEIPDLTNKVAIVTGGNSGIGLETACHLARNNAHVIITCRNKAKCDEAIKQIVQQSNGKGKVEGSIVELSSLKSVKQWLSDIRPRLTRLDMLILNAGVMGPPFELTEDGIESQFGVNHVAHFMIANGLLDVLESTKPHSRVVVVSSASQFQTHSKGVYLTLNEINDKTNYSPMTWYGQSKLANIFFAQELSRRVASKNIYVNAIHPGGVSTNLARHALNSFEEYLGETGRSFASSLLKWLSWTPREGSLTTVFAATSPKIIEENIRGEYFIPVARKSYTHSLAGDKVLQTKLWEFTEDLVKSFKE